MSGINSINVATPPSQQQQVQSQQAVVNPGVSVNQISLSTPPTNFSQGKRFFLSESNGSSHLNTVNASDVQSINNPGGNFKVNDDEYEINASIAYAISTGIIDPSSYMAEQIASNVRLSSVFSQVGASPLQSPSLAGEITGDQFDSAAILAFLKKHKSQEDDSSTKVNVSDIKGNAALKQLIADVYVQLGTIDSNNNQIATLRANENAANHNDTERSITNLQGNNRTALTNAQNDLAKLFSHYSKTGLQNIAESLNKLNKEQLSKLVDTLSKTVMSSISKAIDKNVLAGIPLGQVQSRKILDTNDGSVIKTSEQETQDAIQEQLKSADFQNELAKSIVDHAQALGLGEFSSSDLQSITQSLAFVTADIISNDHQVISDAINNSIALQSDVTNILQLELEGQSGRINTPNNV